MRVGLAKLWRAPLWIVQLATGAKSFVDNPVLGSVALNRRGLHGVRVSLAHRMATSRRRRLASAIDTRHRADFDRDGFLCLPDFLPTRDFDLLRRALLETEHEAREHRQGDTVTRRVAIGPEIIRAIPTAGALLNSRRWKGLMRYVASTGGEPVYFLQSIVTGQEDGPPDPQRRLHADSFQPALKAWLFLNDVAVDEGPLIHVTGSHRLTPQRLTWECGRSVSVLNDGDRLSQRGSLRIDEAELAGLGLPLPTPFVVKANTLVMIDTFGFHARGEAKRPGVRVELWAYRRRSPFLPWTGFSLLSLPGIAHRRSEWSYRILDWLDRRGWWKQHWLPVGKKLADRP